MAAYIALVLSESNVNVANNTSVVTANLYYYGNGVSHNGYPSGSEAPVGQITIDGTTFSAFNHTFTTSTGAQWMGSASKTVTHNADGSRSVSASATFNTKVSLGTLTCSNSLTLTTIPRASTPTLSASSFNAGSALTIYTNWASSAFRHTLTYTLNGSSGTIATGVGASYTWPAANTKALASLLPNATSGVMTIYCYTYNGSTHIGTKSVNVTVNVPSTSEFMPTVSFTTADETECLEKYGKYVQGKSKLEVAVTSAGAYGSSISSRSMTFDGTNYTVESNGVATVNSIKGSGTLSLTVTVKDSRGRTATASKTIQVYPYEAPKITDMVIRRSNQDGTFNSSGAFLAVDFSAEISSLEGKNTANYSLLYKKTGDASYTEQPLTNLTDNYWVDGSTVTFAADTAFSYDVLLVVEDDFYQGDEAISKAGLGSSIEVVWSRAAKGMGFAFGKVAEYIESLGKRLEVAWNARFYKDVEVDGTAKLNCLMTENVDHTISDAEYTQLVDLLNGIVEDHVTPDFGIAADYVVEQGEKEGWFYRKWNSGRCEVERNYHTTKAFTTAIAVNGSLGVYESETSFSVALPVGMFKTVNYPTINVRTGNGGWCENGNANTTVVGFWAVNIVKQTTPIDVYCRIVLSGTWK